MNTWSLPYYVIIQICSNERTLFPRVYPNFLFANGLNKGNWLDRSISAAWIYWPTQYRHRTVIAIQLGDIHIVPLSTVTSVLQILKLINPSWKNMWLRWMLVNSLKRNPKRRFLPQYATDLQRCALGTKSVDHTFNDSTLWHCDVTAMEHKLAP